MALQGQSGKKYGLVIPTREKAQQPNQKNAAPRPRPVAAAFEHSSDSELERSDDEGEKTAKMQISTSKKLAASDYLRMKVKSETQKEIDKAIKDDPTCFQYDEVYDDISHTSTMQRAQEINRKAEKKPKYIQGLLESAEKRKREQERRTERQIQKEREAEGNKFDDKESFVTSAYKTKLKEMKEEEAIERAREAEEAKTDVTKQSDLSMFYRNMLEQRTTRPAPKVEPAPAEDTVDKKSVTGDQDDIDSSQEKKYSRRERSRSRSREQRKRRSRSRSRDRKRHRRSRSPRDRRDKRSRSRSHSRRKSPSHRDRRRRSRSSSPTRPTQQQNPHTKSTKDDTKEDKKIFEKRNADKETVMSARERYLQRKAERNVPIISDN